MTGLSLSWDLTVTDLGAQGDGVAMADDGLPVHIPFTAPGDQVRAVIEHSRKDGHRGRIETLLEPGDRREPPCSYFGTCGGCRVQHLPTDRYEAWKRGILVRALAKRGLDGVPVSALVSTPLAARRRVTLGARRTAAGVVLGFRERAAHRLVFIEACPLLTPALNALLPSLSTHLETALAPGEAADVGLTETDGGVDLLISQDGEPDLSAREAWAAFAEKKDLARVAWQPARDGDGWTEILISRKPATLSFSALEVTLPSGTFLQPSVQGEAVLRDQILEWVPAGGRVAELFAGLGTFTGALADVSKSVLAVDLDAEAMAAMASAAGRLGLGGRIKTEARNLFDQPLRPEDLKSVDAVVLDPPRAGAAAQAEMLAVSAVPRVVMVSCNPETFARDARTLVDGGYQLMEVSPVDQFLYSHHLECIGLFER